MSGGLRKRRLHKFVQVPSSTIRDRRLSFRARGILTYLLDMPDGWDVKSEVIAKEGKEGREAIRSALHELGQHGYYRLEKRQLLNGTFAMGTAISEEPVDDWAADYKEFPKGGVPCIEQRDGSFKVKHKDGSLTDDGFPAEAVDGSDEGPDDDGPRGVTGDGFSGPGFPDSGSPDAGQPDSGSSVAIREKETGDREAVPSDSLRSSDGQAADDSDALFETTDGGDKGKAPASPLTDQEQETGRDADGKVLTGKKLNLLAKGITEGWMDWSISQSHVVTQTFGPIVAAVKAALAGGADPKVLKHALALIAKEGRPVTQATIRIAYTAVTAPTDQQGGRRGGIDWNQAMEEAAARDAARTGGRRTA